jgi:hypothetical protein
MRQTTPGLTLAGIAALFLVACGGGGGGDSSSGGTSPNTPPVANAGTAQTVTAGTTVTLNGTASSDADGTVASYAWTQTTGGAVTLSSTSASQPTFPAPAVATTSTLTFSLVVTDNRGAASSASTVTVTVNPLANLAPTANAGAGQAVVSGASVTLTGAASSDTDGSIASYAWSQTAGTAVSLSSASASQPTFTAPTVAAATTLTFSLVVTDNLGLASAASTVNVVVNPLVVGNVIVSGNITFARVPFATSTQDMNRGLWYATPIQQPSRGVVVRARNAGTQSVLATGSTDEQGNYSLSVTSNTNISIEVVARMQRDSSQALPRWDVRVQDGDTGDNPYTYIDPNTFNSSAAPSHNVAIPTGINSSGVATGTRASGPFAILDTIYQGIQTVRGVAPTINLPALIVNWGSQNTGQAAGTYFDSNPPQNISLLSELATDTDEFDQHVIAHEFGHYIEYNFSRADNIGGSHGLGDKLDPRVAFGEGFGYAFAAIVLNDPNARDSANDNGDLWSSLFPVEDNPATTPVSGNANYGCWCSESSVWSILWDLYDSNADTNDTLALGFQPIWDVLVGTQKTTPAYTTIFSFITALKAARPADAMAINALVAAQNIDATNIDAFATGETHVPTNISAANVLPLYTTIGRGFPLTGLRNVNDAGTGNKIGNHRFLRFMPTSGGTVTVTLTSSNTNNADPDFTMQRAGTYVAIGRDDPPQPETETVNVTANTTYVLDVYDCGNGCLKNDGNVAGDYDLSVSIN